MTAASRVPAGRTIADLNLRLSRGETTREALVAEALEAAARPEAAHVFTRLYADAARASARAADALARAGVQVADGIDVELDAATVLDADDVPLPVGTRIDRPTVVRGPRGSN